MPVYDQTCQGCGSAFQAGSPRAKWCRPGCKKQAQRAAQPSVEVTPSELPSELSVDVPDTGLVASVRSELEGAGRVDTFNGQLALQLARRLADPDESGISSLSKELRTVMAAALDGASPASAGAEPEAPPTPAADELDEIRRRREEARQAAGLA